MCITIHGDSRSGQGTLARRLAGSHEISSAGYLMRSPGSQKDSGDLRRRQGGIRDPYCLRDANNRWTVEGCYARLAEAERQSGLQLPLADPALEQRLAKCRSRPREP
jgi:hypothetical protein